MISLIAQERLLGVTLGSSLVGFAVFEHRRGIYSSISRNKPLPVTQCEKQKQQPGIMENGSQRRDFAHLWNKTVDGTLGRVTAYLSSRGW